MSKHHDTERRDREAEERRRLAPYATFSDASRGRRHTEPAHPARLCFERDRDRVIHSPCFRRLEYKAQVFVNGTADHYRTRMTHTMEMAAVSRTLARLLRVNEELTEAIALAHDIGHTPFGHCGEAVLDELMRDHGGFDHNQQSLRWVDDLEEQYPAFRGLNLSWEVRAGLMKHEAARPGATLDGHPVGPHQSLEAQIADLADDMTYYAHDADDALDAGVLRLGMLETEPLWQRAARKTTEAYVMLTEEQYRRLTVRNLLDILVNDALKKARGRLLSYDPRDAGAVMTAPGPIVKFGDETAAQVKAFRDFLYKNFYFSDAVQNDNQEGVRKMRALFGHYVRHPATMGRKAGRRIAAEGLERTVCDYLSGFTDRYALAEFDRHRLG